MVLPRCSARRLYFRPGTKGLASARRRYKAACCRSGEGWTGDGDVPGDSRFRYFVQGTFSRLCYGHGLLQRVCFSINGFGNTGGGCNGIGAQRQSNRLFAMYFSFAARFAVKRWRYGWRKKGL
ncbi:hypothetical protein NPIL_624421 [Nephila pilipes]|uniref:Uncharacterized protein n=1 Tax=Nephila pilipes TaxID=299642 RepID=A0A8X6NAA9_NEPPI|nr:hypothetical protein NPIL_624421 [Nephila pilipes]